VTKYEMAIDHLIIDRRDTEYQEEPVIFCHLDGDKFLLVRNRFCKGLTRARLPVRRVLRVSGVWLG